MRQRPSIAPALALSLVLAAACGDRASTPSCALPAPAPAAATCIEQPRLGPVPPARPAYDLAGGDTAAAQEAVECFAWESFVALNWPASQGCRGVPDTSATLGPQQALGVFQTFKAPYEVLQPTRRDWRASATTWNDPVPSTGACGDPQATSASAAAPSLDQIVYENSPAFLDGSAVIADQNGNTVVYTLGMNRDEFQYLLDRGWADTGAYDFGGPIAAHAHVQFPDDRDGATGYGAIEVKAAWRILTAADDAQRYVARTAKVFDPETGTCSQQVLGMVALHVVRKVDGQPKWIWSTFEHVDNAPPAGSTGDGRAYGFYSQACAESVPDDCWWATVAVMPSDTAFACCPNILMEVFWLGMPNQLTRVLPDPARPAVNAAFRTALARTGSALGNYVLVGAQWARPSDASAKAFDRPCNPNGAWRVPPPAPGEPCYQQIPALVRNTVIEGYHIANDRDGGQSLTDSCMNCHWATGVDGSFLWLDATSNLYPLQ